MVPGCPTSTLNIIRVGRLRHAGVILATSFPTVQPRYVIGSRRGTHAHTAVATCRMQARLPNSSSTAAAALNTTLTFITTRALLLLRHASMISQSMLRHSLKFNPLVPGLRRPPRLLLSANAVASSSRHVGGAPRTASYDYASYSYIGKGKAKAQWHEEAPVPSLPLSLRLDRSGPFGRPSSSPLGGNRSRASRASIAASSMGAPRSFHATARRDALPLVPALGALLKVCPLCHTYEAR